MFKKMIFTLALALPLGAGAAPEPKQGEMDEFISSIINDVDSLKSKYPNLDNISYHDNSRVLQYNMSSPLLDVDKMSGEDVRLLHFEHVSEVASECYSENKNLINNGNITLRFLYKDKNQRMLSLIDINSATCPLYVKSLGHSATQAP
jgi:hypothetical protein